MLGTDGIAGKGGGPAAGIGTGIGDGVVGSGGGFAVVAGRGDSGSGIEGAFSIGATAAFSVDGVKDSVAGEAAFSTGSAAALSVDGGAADSELVFGSDSRNSGIGCHADFVSLQARSAALKLPSAIFCRMADSEKRPASCPFL